MRASNLYLRVGFKRIKTEHHIIQAVLPLSSAGATTEDLAIASADETSWTGFVTKG